MEIVFILCRPAVAEHIGFAARALNTQGFASLRMVSPCDFLNDTTKKTAYGSFHLLEKARVFNDLKNAVADLDLIVGTSAKRRKLRHDNHTPDMLAELFNHKSGSLKKVGIVFGSEQSGLTSKEISMCHLLSHIPMATKHPSLNLSQSITIYAYALAGLNSKKPDRKMVNNPGLQKELLQRVDILLKELDLNQNASLYQRMLDRLSTVSTADMALMMQVLDKLDRQD